MNVGMRNAAGLLTSSHAGGNAMIEMGVGVLLKYLPAALLLNETFLGYSMKLLYKNTVPYQ